MVTFKDPSPKKISSYSGATVGPELQGNRRNNTFVTYGPFTVRYGALDHTCKNRERKSTKHSEISCCQLVSWLAFSLQSSDFSTPSAFATSAASTCATSTSALFTPATSTFSTFASSSFSLGESAAPIFAMTVFETSPKA